MTRNDPSSGDPIGVRRKAGFWLVMLLIPIMALGFLEATLRLAGYGGSFDLAVRQEHRGTERYVLNRSYASRYFPGARYAVPELTEDSFDIGNTRTTVRIFCIGESTMAGFPYEFQATAPAMLEELLSNELPESRIEAINAGLSAVGSFIILEMMEAAMAYDPDLIVVYSGHNEFYGAFGGASTVGSGGSPAISRLTLSLLNLRTFLAFRDLVLWVRSRLAPTSGESGRPLMAEMIGQELIPLGSDLYQTTRSAYRENLTRMIELSRKHGVPLLFVSPVSNIRHHAPFSAGFSTADSTRQRDWRMQMRAGDSLVSLGSIDHARRRYQQAISLDSLHALAWFRLGQADDAAGRFDEAREAYVRAKDLDLLRFRASSEFEADLRSICELSGTPLVRLDSAFTASAPQGIPGSGLFMEHLHPTIGGYAIMARAILKSIREHRLLGLPANPAGAQELPDKDLIERSGITVFDSTAGRIKIEILKHQWPLVSVTENFQYRPRNDVEAIAHRYVRGGMAWSKARYDLGEHFWRAGSFELARREFLALSKVVPDSYEPLLRVADAYRREGRDNEALEAYRRCVAAEDNPYARLKGAVILLERSLHDTAAAEIERALALAHGGRFSLTIEAAGNARYLLAVALAGQGKFDRARKQAEEALRFNPSDPAIEQFLRHIQEQRRR